MTFQNESHYHLRYNMRSQPNKSIIITNSWHVFIFCFVNIMEDTFFVLKVNVRSIPEQVYDHFPYQLASDRNGRHHIWHKILICEPNDPLFERL